MKGPVVEMLELLTLRIAVHEAVLRSILANHNQPQVLRQQVECLMAQVQATSAALGSQVPQAEAVQEILDGLFRGPVTLSPDA